MDQAMSLERQGEWAAAIEIYARVADCYPANTTYAQNCIRRLQQYELLQPLPEPQVSGVAWRHKRLLITRDATELPMPCVITNTTADVQVTPLKLPASNILPVYGLAQIIGPLAFVFHRPKSIGLGVPLSAAGRKRRLVASFIAWLAFPVALTVLFAQAAVVPTAPPGVLGVVLTVVFAFVYVGSMVATLIALRARRLLAVRWIRGSYVAVAGAHKDYLAQLPIFPLEWRDKSWVSGGSR
jgi:hypothetical protein